MSTVLAAKNARYCASASSMTYTSHLSSEWTERRENGALLTSEYADENSEMRTLRSTIAVTVFQLFIISWTSSVSKQTLITYK
jgi:hypothetical protein